MPGVYSAVSLLFPIYTPDSTSGARRLEAIKFDASWAAAAAAALCQSYYTHLWRARLCDQPGKEPSRLQYNLTRFTVSRNFYPTPSGSGGGFLFSIDRGRV